MSDLDRSPLSGTLLAHAATVVVTLALARWLFVERGRIEPRCEAQAASNAATLPVAPAPPPPLPPEVLAQVEADEAVNMHVYESCNRGVVHLTSASESPLGGAEVAGTGSGFLIDRAGHILTNHHVISQADALQVTLFDGTTLPARLVGVDPNNDVAVVQIDAPPDSLSPLPLGDSSGLRVGQKVLALGNPFGLERTLTDGIISALDRSMKTQNQRTIKGIIQTDAAINPGNSGGPLLNSRGEVIGINTAIISQVGQSAGIGFAVPINTIKRNLTQLLERGRVVRADLGVRSVYATERGLYIVDLVEGGAAERAGLRPIQVVIERLGRYYRKRPDPDGSDRIVAVDGKPVQTVDDLLSEVERHEPGETADLTVVRQGRRRQVEVVLGASDD